MYISEQISLSKAALFVDFFSSTHSDIYLEKMDKITLTTSEVQFN